MPLKSRPNKGEHATSFEADCLFANDVVFGKENNKQVRSEGGIGLFSSRSYLRTVRLFSEKSTFAAFRQTELMRMYF